MKKTLLLLLALLSVSCFAQTLPCEFSNTAADAANAVIDAATGQGFSAPNGIGAVVFRVPIACQTNYVSYHIYNPDASASSAPNTYDLGLYCVSGDCTSGGANAGKLYLHIGPIAGRNFSNNRVATTLTGATASGTGSVVTFTVSFNVPDFPVGIKFTVTGCSITAYNTTYNAVTSTGSAITANGTASGAATGCQLVSSTVYPPGFANPSTCSAANTNSLNCQMALPWVADARTVCVSIPCTLPAGLYAAAWGTNCNNVTASNCAQLAGDADLGMIYPLTAQASGTCPGSGTCYDASGLPASMTLTVSTTTPRWNTTTGATAPIKPAKLLVYFAY